MATKHHATLKPMNVDVRPAIRRVQAGYQSAAAQAGRAGAWTKTTFRTGWSRTRQATDAVGHRLAHLKERVQSTVGDDELPIEHLLLAKAYLEEIGDLNRARHALEAIGRLTD